MTIPARLSAAAASQWRRPEVESVTLYLPLPISVNRLWSNRKGGGRRCSDAYKAWKAEAAAMINIRRPGRVSGPYALDLQISTSWRGDQDNALKCVNDALQANGIIDNDRKASRTVVAWADAIEGCAVTIRKAAASHETEA